VVVLPLRERLLNWLGLVRFEIRDGSCNFRLFVKSCASGTSSNLRRSPAAEEVGVSRGSCDHVIPIYEIDREELPSPIWKVEWSFHFYIELLCLPLEFSAGSFKQ
jgi:hypothetical protein